MTQPKSIILDCDPGEDDALAILYALQKNLPVKALVCGFGNTSHVNTERNGAGLLTLAGRTDIPFFKGATAPYLPHPLEKTNVDAGAFVGANGMCGVELPAYLPIEIANGHQDEAQRLDSIADFVRTHGAFTYIVTGPCSTLAHILQILGNDAGRYIDRIIVMGGALDVAGNHGPINPDTGKSYAEFNFYCDPHGAEAVLKSGIPVTIVAWDLTENIVLRYRELQNMQASDAVSSFVLDLMKTFLESFGIANQRAFEFNDCITLVAYEGAGAARPEVLSIATSGEKAGQLVRDPVHGSQVNFFQLDEGEIVPVRNAILQALGIRFLA